MSTTASRRIWTSLTGQRQPRTPDAVFDHVQMLIKTSVDDLLLCGEASRGEDHIHKIGWDSGRASPPGCTTLAVHCRRRGNHGRVARDVVPPGSSDQGTAGESGQE